MPLNQGAKPGSKKFGLNIATEINAGKPKIRQFRLLIQKLNKRKGAKRNER
jgi:hypothetical protein